ncbi:metallophosphoesterase [Bacillus sp. IITD106]|nr:metallophosphoesterase [Bacillus sp. IITD106]
MIHSSCIVRNEVTEDGHIYIQLKELDRPKIRELGQLTFKLQSNLIDQFSIKFESGKATVKGRRQTPVYFPPMEISTKAHYKIAYDRATLGFESHITVTDDKGFGVHGTTIQVISPGYSLGVVNDETASLYKNPSAESEVLLHLNKGVEIVVEEWHEGWLKVAHKNKTGWLQATSAKLFPWILGKTDQNGRLKTNRLSLIQGRLMIQAQKEQKYSFPTKINVLNHLGSQTPECVNLTFSEFKNAMNISWITNPLHIKSVIQFLHTEDYKQKGFTGYSLKQEIGNSIEHAFEAGEVQVHSVTLKGLEPGQSYTYRAGDGTKSRWSEAGSFTVESKKSNDQFSFIIMGDTQAPPNQTEKGFALFTKIFTKAKRENQDAAFIIHVGDMVDDGNLYSHWAAFFESIKHKHLAPSTPIIPVVGNHENTGNGVETFKKIFKMPNNGPMNFKGTVYSFDYGNAHFAILNTETTESGLQEQAEWLKKDMTETTKMWKIVVYHRSPYNANTEAGSERVKEAWTKVFDELNIDLAISGHDHSYVRTFPLKDGMINEKGTTYIIAGLTGHKFYGATPQSYMDVCFDEKIQVYLNVFVAGNRLSFIVKTHDGRIVDEFTIDK